MNEIILYHHLGLGDHFICNGLVNALSEQYDKIYLPCKPGNFITVNSLYQDNNIVEVCVITDDMYGIYNLSNQLGNIPILTIGFKDFDAKTFDKSFYIDNGFDFSLRYSNFKLPANLTNAKFVYNSLINTTEYCLIHTETSCGNFDINITSPFEKVYIKRGLTENLLDYIDVIKNAKEIHCVDSSVYHLIDSLDIDANLFYYNVRNSENNKITVSNKWKII